MPTIEERFASLEASNRALAQDVQGLTAALTAITELQAQQREMARKTRETSRAVEEVRQEAEHRARRTNTALKLSTLVLAVLLPVVSLLVYASLITHVDRLLDQNARERLAACKTRNEAAQINIEREKILARVENDGPEAVQAHLQSAAALEKKIIDCDKLYGAGGAT